MIHAAARESGVNIGVSSTKTTVGVFPLLLARLCLLNTVLIRVPIVGTNFPADADPRPRRGKKRNFRSSVSMNSPSPTNAEAEEGESDVDVTPKQETVQSPRRQSARQAQKRMDEMMEACLSPPSSFTSLLEVVNSGMMFQRKHTVETWHTDMNNRA